MTKLKSVIEKLSKKDEAASRQDFEALAGILNKYATGASKALVKKMADDVAGYFQGQHTGFDKARFMKAAGL